MEVTPKVYAVRFYDGSSENRYCASLQVMVDGDVGIIHTLNGRMFFSLDGSLLCDIFEKCQVNILYAHMEKTTALLLARSIKGYGELKIVGKKTLAGRELHFVSIKKK